MSAQSTTNVPGITNHRARARNGRSVALILLRFLGSMNLAITLLVVVAIASIIGSVLQQDQSWNAYLSKFGPFWFEHFRILGLYDVYSAPWFIAMLGFLVLSTSVCLYQHTPVVWKEFSRYRERQADASLRAHRNHREFTLPVDPPAARALAESALRKHGYRVRAATEQNRTVLAGMQGRGNRLGYLFSHLAIVVICAGALIDANPRIILQGWAGQLHIETRDDLPLSELPAESLLPAGRSAFRGNISIPEGGAGRAVYLSRRDGYVARELSFAIEVSEFRISYWDNGQPRSYESDLIIHDPTLDEPLHHTIGVNSPLNYRGYSIYQASYSDGGTAMNLRLWPLGSRAPGAVDAETAVHGDLPLTISERRYTLEMLEFEKQNVHPDHSNGERGTRDIGPSFTYRLRKPTGEAREFHNFMQPVDVDGRFFFLTGMRTGTAEEFRYLYIPADPSRSLDRFMRLMNALQTADMRHQASADAVGHLLEHASPVQHSLAPYLTASVDRLIVLLLDGGLPAVERGVRDQVSRSGLNGEAAGLITGLLRDAFHGALSHAYGQVLIDEGYPSGAIRSGALSDEDNRFFGEAMDVLMVLPAYGAPVFPELLEYRHRQATGLQITRAPGQGIVYLGCALLTAGLFLMFYVRHRRVWVRLAPNGASTTGVLMAGQEQRRGEQFAREFHQLANRIEAFADAGVKAHPPS